MGSQIEKIRNLEKNKYIIIDDLSSSSCKEEIGENIFDFKIIQMSEIKEENNSLYIAKVESLKNHKIYVVEKIGKQTSLTKFYFEQISKLKDFDNPNIIKYYNLIEDYNCFYLIREYMELNINDFIEANKLYNENIKEEIIWKILLQCLSGLQYLHIQNVADLGIKLTNIFMKDEYNVKIGIFNLFPKMEDIKYNYKIDINFLGKYFYEMCFNIGQKKVIYSKELIDIITIMNEKDFNKIPDSYILYNEVLKKFIQKYSQNSSISSIFRCLYSLPGFNDLIFKISPEIKKYNKKYIMNSWCLKIINILFGYEKENINECIEEFRLFISSKYPDLEENKEINPFHLLIVLLKDIFTESNQIIESNEFKKEKKEKNIINSVFDTEKIDKSNKAHAFCKFLKHYNYNVNSPIFDLFCGIILTEVKCQICENINYSLSNFFFLYFDISNKKDDEIYDLIKDGFENKKLLYKEKNDYCEKCLIYQNHIEVYKYYKMPDQLIIYFDRGYNYKNKSNILFEEKLNVENYIEDNKDSPKDYYLTGSINRLIDKGKEKFIYCIREPNNKNNWNVNDSKIYLNCDNAPINKIQSNGEIILLFYNNVNIK